MVTIQELKSEKPDQLGRILRELIAENFGLFAKNKALSISISPQGNVVIVTTSNPNDAPNDVNSAHPSHDAS